MIKKLKAKILNAALSHLFRAVVMEDVMTIQKDGRIFMNGDQISDKDIKKFQEEAKMISETDLWKVMIETIRHLSQQKMYTKAISFDDMFFGKAMLYCTDLMVTFVKTFLNYTFRK